MNYTKVILLGCVLNLTSCICSFSQSPQDTIRILFVGNSYIHGNNLPQIVSIISDYSDTKLITQKSTRNGAKLSQHWKGERGLKTKELIQQGNFDIVVLQEQSMGTIIQPDSVLYYSKLLCEFIKDNGATPYLFQTWARKKVPQFQETITEIYSKSALENGAKIIPAGEAWKLAIQLRPSVELYAPDGSHPSDLGTFLTACVFVSTITGNLPDDIKSAFRSYDIYGESIQLMKIDGLDIIFCRKIVEELYIGP